MPYFFKPVVWNSEGYRRPSGGRFSSGFPKGAIFDPDLSKLGEALRAHVPAIAFDRFVIRNRVR